MARITDNQIEFLFKNQSDSDGSGITGDFGKVSIYVNFPGDIVSISENRAGSVKKINSKRIQISAPGNANLDIRILSNLSGVSTTAPKTEQKTSVDLSQVSTLNTQVKIIEAKVVPLVKSKNKFFSRAKYECAVPLSRNKGLGPDATKILAVGTIPTEASINSYVRLANQYILNYERCSLAMLKYGYVEGQSSTASTPKPTPVATPTTSSATEEVIAGEEVDEASIKAELLSNKNTRILVTGAPLTAYTVVATKSGVTKKIVFNLRTDSQGNKIFQTTSQLLNYKLALLQGTTSVASTVVTK